MGEVSLNNYRNSFKISLCIHSLGLYNSKYDDNTDKSQRSFAVQDTKTKHINVQKFSGK